MAPDGSVGGVETKAGYVALVGRPNVGKSTLLNALTGEVLSIVTARAQTTRDRVFGIYTTEAVQVIFVDTPGLLEPEYLLQQSMLETALAAARDADEVLLLLDGLRPGQRPEGEALELLRSRRDALTVAVNKVDRAKRAAVEALVAWSRASLGLEPHRVSAAQGTGLEALKEALAARLPASPFFYPPDDVAVQPVRFFVAEFVRETIFEMYEQEVPYSTVVRVEEFREAEEPVYIRATIYVERDSQKGILLGKGGARIRELGSLARVKIETFLGTRVYLDLWVKTMAGWRRKRGALRHLGYPVPAERPARDDR